MASPAHARFVTGRPGRSYQAGLVTPPAAPGFVPPSPDEPRSNRQTAKQLKSREALYGRTSYYAGPSHARYSSYPGTGVEPQQIWNLQLLRNNGYPQLWTEFVEQTIERDGHLGGVGETRRLSVVDKPFRLHPSHRGDPTADMLARICERMVDQIDSFDQTCDDLLSAPAYGYALSELVYVDARLRLPTEKGSRSVAELVLPRTIDWLHWKHVRFNRWTDEPYLWLNDGEYSLDQNKYVFHAASGTGLIEKRGYMGSCAWLSSAKRWSERDWLVYGKIFGIPTILAQYPNGLQEYDAHRNEYQQILKDWGEGIPALLPEELVVDIKRDGGGKSDDVHGAIIGWANSEISKRVLGSTLTVEIGNTGAYAAADTHRDAPYMRSRADAKKLASTIRRDVLTPFVRLNRYALADILGVPPEEVMERVPRCSWRIEREMTPVQRQEVYEGAVNELGLDVDEDQYRDEMGFDPPRPGGRQLRGKPIAVGSGGLAPSVEASREGAPAPQKDDPKSNPPAPPAKGHRRRSAKARKTPR
jgi:phage gp29-like protein